MCGEINIDWEEWTKDQLFKRLRIQYFGGCDRNHLRTVVTEKETRTRKCYECEAPLHVYENLHTYTGKPAEYQFNNTIKTFAKDYDFVLEAVGRLRPILAEEKSSLGKIAPKVAFVVSKGEIVENSKDLNKE